MKERITNPNLSPQARDAINTALNRVAQGVKMDKRQPKPKKTSGSRDMQDSVLSSSELPR